MATTNIEPVPEGESTLPSQLQALTDLVDDRPEAFAEGDEEIRNAGLAAAKFIFDMALKTESVAFPAIETLVRSVQSMSDDIITRSTASRKRKRSDPEPKSSDPSIAPTPLNELFLDGMGEDQIWEQLELRAKKICTVAQAVLELDEGLDEEDDEGRLASDALDLEDDDSEEEEDEDDSELSWPEDEEEEGEDEDEGEEGYGEEGFQSLRGEEEDDGEDDDMDGDEDDPLHFFSDTPSSSRIKSGPKHPTLDDEFFSIDDFNRDTEAMEALTRSAGHLDEEEEDDDEGDEEVDLLGAVQEEPEDQQEPTYADFFAAPRPARTPKPRPPPSDENGSAEKRPGVRFNDSVRVKTIKPKVKRKMQLDFDPDMYPFGLEDAEAMELDDEDDSEDGDYEDGDMDGLEDGEENEDGEGESDEEDGGDFEGQDETIDRLKDDLFGDDDDELEETNLSNHGKRLAALSEQIAALEAENVGKKDWTLMGEASAKIRPVNSLLEEDLDFEHQGKQVPVVTEETTKGLEELIKRRILDASFNDVVRKRPLDDKPFLPSRMFDLQDTQSQKSLAQIYEDEYTAARTGDTSVLDDRDGKLKKEHEEIEKMWEDIAYKLDALSNAHFTPKAPKATITTISNVPVVSLESALPTTASTSTLLAPEEVFTSNPADLRSKSELTPAEKLTVRRREKRAKKTEQAKLGSAVDAFGKAKKGKRGEKGEKEQALKQIVKAGRGVTVVGKKPRENAKAVPRAADLKL